ncbi:hypothetical protein Tco_1420850 [Tanacetum coccineum]
MGVTRLSVLNPSYHDFGMFVLGALYNIIVGCSKGGLVDKDVCDCPNKTPESSQRTLGIVVEVWKPRLKVPNVEDVLYGEKKLKDSLVYICHENGIYKDLLNTYESSDDDTNVVNAPREPFVVKQDPGENSSQKVLHQINQIVVTSVVIR